ncbi:MAG: VWA domain-containing protein [Phycisphaerales bacterium]
MTFATAWLAVAGVAAAAVPILIHLFMRRRRQPVHWAAMRLLAEAMRRQSRRLRLQHLIVLALRCLLLALVGAAAAQPLLRAAGMLGGAGERAGGRVVLLAIDNGLASGALDSAGARAGSATTAADTALARHVATAQAVLERLAPGDAVGVVTAARPAHGMVLPPTTDHAAVTALLRSLEPMETPSDIPAALATVREALDREEQSRAAVVYLLSDFRAGSATLSSPLSPLFVETSNRSAARNIRLLASIPESGPASTTIDNTQVVAIDPLRRLLLPGQGDGSGQVTIRLMRFGDLRAATNRVALTGAEIKPRPPHTIEWRAGQDQATIEMLVEPTGTERAALGVEASVEPDALRPDDAARIVLESRRTVRVALIDRRGFGAETVIERLSAGQWIARALRPAEDSPAEVVVEDPARLASRSLRGIDAAIVARPDALADEGWDALRDLLARGGLVIVLPPEELNAHVWTDRLVQALGAPLKLGIEPVETPGGVALAERQPSSALLRLLDAELNALARPVRVLRRLPMELRSGAAQPVLVADDGSALVAAMTVAPPAPRGAEGTSTKAGVAPAGDPLQPTRATAPAATGTALPGTLVVFAMAPELSWTDLPIKPLMVPLMQEIVRQGVGLGGEAMHARVGDRLAVPASVTALASVEQRDGRPRWRVDISSGRSVAVEHAGLYRLLDAADQQVGLIAVDVDMAACDTRAQSPDAVTAWLRGSGPWNAFEPANPTAPLQDVEQGAPISGALLIAALACAIAETIFARRFSYATRPAEGRLAEASA